MKLLIIEDEKALSQSISSYLSSDNFTCECVYDFADAMKKIAGNEYACIILDINLPGGSGLRILQELKSMSKDDGVLIVSARNSLEDRVNGLNLGADDYLPKPFHLPELKARITAIIRRKSFGGGSMIRFDQLSLDLLGKTVTINEKVVELTRKEYELLL
ncbi:MAG: response regulator, partial [Bacteroidetes bacterium]|nr:response regulator [Bacteroidota bacterium]